MISKLFRLIGYEKIMVQKLEVSDPVVQANIDRLRNRHLTGMKTYGMSMSDNPLNALEWIDHTIEELLDAANYLERLKLELPRETIKI